MTILILYTDILYSQNYTNIITHGTDIVLNCIKQTPLDEEVLSIVFQ